MIIDTFEIVMFILSVIALIGLIVFFTICTRKIVRISKSIPEIEAEIDNRRWKRWNHV